MKKIISVLVVISLILSLSVTGFAWALRAPREEEGKKVESIKTKDDVFFDDFTTYEEGGLPTSVQLRANDPSKAEIVEYLTPSGNKKVLKLSDNQPEAGGVVTTVAVPEHDAPITFELRMNHKTTTTLGNGFVMDFTDAAGNKAFRLIRFSNENACYTFVNSGGNKPITLGANHDDIWYTVKLRIDPQKKQVGIIIASDEIKNATLNVSKYANVLPVQDDGYVLAYSLPWFNEFASDKITKITMSTYGNNAGEYIIDYMKFTANVPEEAFLPVRTRAESKEIASVNDPVLRLVPGIVNLDFKGEIKYLANPVILNNGRSMIDANEFAALYDMELSKDGNDYKLTGENGEITFSADSASFKVDGKAGTAVTTPIKENNTVYIPVKSFVEAMGDTVQWQDAPQCVIIK